MKKNVIIFGSDTKLGIIAYNFFKSHSNQYNITSLSCYNLQNYDKFLKQIKEIKPRSIFIPDSKLAEDIEDNEGCDVFYGSDGLLQFLKLSYSDIAIFALPGIKNVKIILSAINEYKDICIVNLEPLVYSGYIIPKEAKRKGVNLSIISFSVYSMDQFLKSRFIGSINSIALYTSYESNKPKKSYETISVDDDYSLFLYNFYNKNNINIINKLLLIIYLYDIPLEKFKFYIETKSVINIGVGFNDGSFLTNSTTKNLNNIFNYYFLEYGKLLNQQTPDVFGNINISIKKIDPTKNKYLKLGLYAIKKGGSCPILYYIVIKLFVKLLFDKKIKSIDFNLLKEIIFDKKLYVKHPDLSTILALEKKTEDVIYKKCVIKK